MKSADQPDLSIIIPIYNVEEFLPQCLDSVVAQDIASYEAILVNDGTRDNSGEIAKDYTRRYPELFRYIEQENQGLSVARNVGVTHSRGIFVTFLDSDDFLTESGLAELLQLAKDKNSDITVGNLWHLMEDGSKQKNKAFIAANNCVGESWLRQCFRRRKYFPAAWYRLFRREFLTNNNLEFVPQQTNEDQLYTVRTMLMAESVTSADIPFYMYRHRSGSITRSRDLAQLRKSVKSDAAITMSLYDLCIYKCDSELMKLIMNHCIKLLRTSGAPLCGATAGSDPLIGEIADNIDKLKLYRYLRIYRISHLVDWIMLRRGFRNYLAWRSRKIRP